MPDEREQMPDDRLFVLAVHRDPAKPQGYVSDARLIDGKMTFTFGPRERAKPFEAELRRHICAALHGLEYTAYHAPLEDRSGEDEENDCVL